ncbi:MAG: hypothetical protein KBT28_12165 [Bacteroidales bacterium]|nr:hypothetical protein [Candidatus Colimorpha merdihippi]
MKNDVHTCIYCGKDFDKAPAEHILQNSLCTKWTCDTIMCGECQSRFGDAPDVAMGEFSKFFRAPLNIGTGRDKEKKAILSNITDDQGHKYVIKPGFLPELLEPYIETSHDRVKIIYSANRKDHEQWGKHIAREAGYKLGDTISKEKSSNGPQQLHGKFIFDFKNICVALLKSAFNLLGANDINLALNSAFGQIRNDLFQLNHEACIGRVASYAPSSLPYDNYAFFAHQVYVYSKGKTVLALIRLFGSVTFHMLLSDNYQGENISYYYVTDPLLWKAGYHPADSDPSIVTYLPEQLDANSTFEKTQFYKNIYSGFDFFMRKFLFWGHIYPLTQTDNSETNEMLKDMLSCLIESKYDLICEALQMSEANNVHDIAKAVLRGVIWALNSNPPPAE